MPIYKVSLRKAHDASWPDRRKWSNTFYLNTANAAAAASAMVVAWVDYLRDAVRTTVFAYSVFASSIAEGDSDFIENSIPVELQRGTFVPDGVTAGEPYLLKACSSVKILVAGSRASRKFWRPGLYEGDIVSGRALVAPFAARIVSQFNTMIGDGGGIWVDPDNEPYAQGVTQRVTTREFGREASIDVPEAPPT